MNEFDEGVPLLTNKYVADMLTNYFSKQDPRMVARLLSNALLDINRYYTIKQLDKEEKKEFLERMDINAHELYKFIMSPDGAREFKLTHWQTLHMGDS